MARFTNAYGTSRARDIAEGTSELYEPKAFGYTAYSPSGYVLGSGMVNASDEYEAYDTVRHMYGARAVITIGGGA